MYTPRYVVTKKLPHLINFGPRATAVRTVTTDNDAQFTAQNPFPYPKKPHPNPFEIFHLRPGTPQSAVKARYYELVRFHHPDSPHARRLPPNVSRARFQAITAAYDVLTGKMRPGASSHRGPRTASTSAGPGRHSHPYGRYHHYHAEWAEQARTAAMDEGDDHRKDMRIMAIGLVTLVVGFIPFLFMSHWHGSERRHFTAAHNLAQAREEAREHGHVRRRQIQKLVMEVESEVSKEERPYSIDPDEDNR